MNPNLRKSEGWYHDSFDCETDEGTEITIEYMHTPPDDDGWDLDIRKVFERETGKEIELTAKEKERISDTIGDYLYNL